MAKRTKSTPNRTTRVQVRFTEAEHRAVVRHAEDAGVSQSEFVRLVFRHGLRDLYEGRAELVAYDD